MTGGSSSSRKALRIALLYLVLGAVWIACSDALLDYFGPADADILTVYQTWKGWVFIIFTAVLLFLLINESLGRQDDAIERLATSEARLSYLLSANPTVLYVLEIRDGKPCATWVSGNVTRILGYSTEEALADNWWADNLHPDDRKRELSTTLAALKEEHVIHEYRFRHKHEGYLWIRDELRIIREERNSKVEIIGSWSDISDRRREEEKMRLYAAAFESSRDGVIITDPDTKIISANQAFKQTVGYGEDELIGETPRLFDSGRHDAEYYRQMWAQLKGAGHWQGELWIRLKNGEVSPQWLTINTVHDDNGRLTHYVAVYSDISKLKQSEEQLERLAHYDVLTNLPNRMLLDLRLNHAIEQTHRRGGHLGVLFLDLDDFKKVNDSLGHAYGDELLISVAKRLRLRVRGEDTLGRFGGDEFLIILESLDRPEEAATVARDLLASLRQPFRLSSGHDVYAQCSIGISLYPDDGGSTEELLRNADTAMYRAKRNGRNQFQFFTDEMSQNTVLELEMETALRQALNQESLILHYQPKVDLHGGDITGMEALIRWERQGGLVPPARFIPIAENTGLIVPIGAWAINRVCRQIREWLDDNLDPRAVAVNVSAAQFRPGNLEDVVRAALEENGLEGSRLELEITESSLMDHPEEIIETMENLNKMGVRLSLDDFGTGFSSLSYLTRFPIEIMKIEGSFVHNMVADENARAIVDSIIELAHGLGMRCVAEMVESAPQAEYLATRGCDEVQGYFFYRDLPVAEITQLLREGKSFYKV